MKDEREFRGLFHSAKTCLSDSSITAVVSPVLWLAGQSQLHSFYVVVSLLLLLKHRTVPLKEPSSAASRLSVAVLYRVNTLTLTVPAGRSSAAEEPPFVLLRLKCHPVPQYLHPMSFSRYLSRLLKCFMPLIFFQPNLSSAGLRMTHAAAVCPTVR